MTMHKGAWWAAAMALAMAWTSMARAQGDALIFKAYGKEKSRATAAEMAEKAKGRELTVREPNSGEDRTFLVVPAKAVLDAMYGDAWRKADEVLFTCADGYQPSVPVQRFLEKDAYLAYGAKGDPAFHVVNRDHDGKDTPLGPYYLVWDNLKDPELLAEGGTHWPYQVVGLDLIDFASKFPKLAPPAKSDARVREGFLLFRKHCMSCHALNGEGGGVSHVDLNSPVSVTAYFKEPWLEKWIADPAAMRPKTPMPAFPRDVPDRAAKIRAIIAYLKAMDKAR